MWCCLRRDGVQGNMKVARKEFRIAMQSLNHGWRSVSGHLALGRLEFAEKRYSEALIAFKRALVECPSCPPAVRTAIGMCYFFLGNVDKARKAFNRALELQPRSTQPLLGLAVLHALEHGHEGEQAANACLAKAYLEDPTNPYTLALLSHHALQQGLFDVSLKLSRAAYDRIPFDEANWRAEIETLAGRCHHAQGNISSALEHYQRALSIRKGHQVASLALAQLTTAKRDFAHASSLFQSILKAHPHWVDALSCFGPLIPHFNFKASMPLKQIFIEMARKEKSNKDLWQIAGDVNCVDDPAIALKAYLEGLSLYGKSSSENIVPIRLLNNIAVLYFRSEQMEKSYIRMSEAIENMQLGGFNDLHPASQVTLGYNMARIREAVGDLGTAEKEYESLLKEFPKYIDCLLRLACISKKRGDIAQAEYYARKASETSSSSADALALLSGIYIERRDLANAKNKLEALQSALAPGLSSIEVYGRVALGNIHLYSIPGELQEASNVRKASIHLAHAMGLYRRALEKDPGNLFAANGVGCVLAESGQLHLAKEIFLSVQEAAAATDGFQRIPDAWINLASVQLGLSQFKAAEVTYIQAIKRYSQLKLDPRLLLYLAKTQHEGGATHSSMRTISKAIHLAPSDHRLRFNAAYLMQQDAAKCLQDSESFGEEEKVAEYRKSTLSFESSHRIFSWLHKLGQNVSGIASKKLEHHIEFASKMHKTSLAKLNKAKKEAQAASLKKNELKLRRRAAEKFREMEIRKEQAELQATLSKDERIAQQAELKLQRMKSSWKQGKEVTLGAGEGDITGISKPGPKSDPLDGYFNVSGDDEDFDPQREKNAETEGLFLLVDTMTHGFCDCK